MKFFMYLIALLIFISCSEKKEFTGNWQFVLKLKEESLPFILNISKDPNQKLIGKLYNAEETISLPNIKVLEDNIEIELNEKVSLSGHLSNNKLTGFWIKHERVPEYKVPFVASRVNHLKRFENVSSQKLEKKWKIIFSPDKAANPMKEGLLLIKQNSPIVYASILTKTGDYRYLEGSFKDNHLNLYGFDGVFAFVVKAKLEAGILKGKMHAGKSHVESFVAKAQADYELPNPEALTYVDPKDSLLKFSLKNANGELIQFSGKSESATILQIFGSWCPNCIDETLFLNQWIQQNPDINVNIFAIAFEREKNEKDALKTLKKVKNKLKMNYPLLLGGVTKEDTVKKLFPNIKDFMSFPTTIFIDKNGKVRKIHTGFNGPATGFYFDEFKKNFDVFVKRISLE